MPPTKKQKFSTDVSNTTLRAYYMEDIITEPEHAIQVASYQPIISRERCLYVCKWLSRAYNYHLFAQPVDWETLGLLNYPDIIKNPMDFSTIVQYVRSDAFIFKVFLDHCRLVWSNAQKYNTEGHPVHIVSKRLSRMFENKIVMMQTHQYDDDPYKIRQQLHSIFFAVADEDYALDFCSSVNVELYPEYARMIDIPYCLSYIQDDLLEAAYHNKYDVLDDMNHIVKNSIQFNGDTSELGINALHMKDVFERLFLKRLKDFDSPYFITNFMKNQCIQNISNMEDMQRIEMMRMIQTICPDAISQKDDVSSISIDMLSQSEFLRIDTFVRKFVVVNATMKIDADVKCKHGT